MPTRVTCPNGHTFQAPISIEGPGVTFYDNAGGNLVVPCPVCGVTFDAAPDDGVYRTIGGRLQQVAGFLASADRDELLALEDRIRTLDRERDDQRAVETLAQVGVAAPKGGWLANRANRQELYTVLSLLLTIITMVIALRASNQGLSTSDVETIVKDVMRHQSGP